MVYVMFFALSMVAALAYNPVSGFVNRQAATLSAQSTQAQKVLGSFLGRTAVQAAAFFVVLITAASVMSLLGDRKAAEIPTVG